MALKPCRECGRNPNQSRDASDRPPAVLLRRCSWDASTIAPLLRFRNRAKCPIAGSWRRGTVASQAVCAWPWPRTALSKVIYQRVLTNLRLGGRWRPTGDPGGPKAGAPFSVRVRPRVISAGNADDGRGLAGSQPQRGVVCLGLKANGEGGHALSLPHNVDEKRRTNVVAFAGPRRAS